MLIMTHFSIGRLFYIDCGNMLPKQSFDTSLSISRIDWSPFRCWPCLDVSSWPAHHRPSRVEKVPGDHLIYIVLRINSLSFLPWQSPGSLERVLKAVLGWTIHGCSRWADYIVDHIADIWVDHISLVKCVTKVPWGSGLVVGRGLLKFSFQDYVSEIGLSPWCGGAKE